MSAVKPIGFDFNNKVNRVSTTSSKKTEIRTFNKSNIAFKGDPFPPKLTSFLRSFKHLFNSITGANITPDGSVLGSYLIWHDQGKISDVAKSYLTEKCREEFEIAKNASPNDIRGLVKELTKHYEKFAYNITPPNPCSRLIPENVISLSIYEKPLQVQTQGHVARIPYNTQLYDFLASGKLPKNQYAIGNDRSIYKIISTPGEYAGYKYVELRVDPV